MTQIRCEMTFFEIFVQIGIFLIGVPAFLVTFWKNLFIGVNRRFCERTFTGVDDMNDPCHVAKF